MKRRRLRSFLATASLAVSFVAAASAVEKPSAAKPPADDAKRAAAEAQFVEYVEPILKQHCYECHSHAAGKAKGGLVLDSRGGWAKGGDNGPAVVPGKPDDSLLIQAVRYDGLEMPPTGKLPADAVAKLERWVRDGAHDPRVIETTQGATGIDLAAGRKHWAFQPLARAAVPQVQQADWPRADVDRYLLAALEAKGLSPSSDADRYTWLRRVSFDLTGLPPTLDEIEAFVADRAQGAEERVVDRLLASRAYGERWARHWLDLVGYADQIGTANNIFAEQAWRYRDYVVESLNADKPFDAFVREQLAGDLLPAESPSRRAELLTATGFLLLGDLTVVEADKPKLRIDTVDQQVDKIGRAFLGMTLGCARCHDHKFDPIPQHDYYAMAGVLNSTESIVKAAWGIWSWPNLADLPETDAQRAERLARAATHEARLGGLRSERKKLQALKDETDRALEPPKDADDKKSSTEKTPPLAEVARAALVRVQQDQAERLKRLDREIQHAEFFAPTVPQAFAVRDVAEPADMQITIRGNAYALGERVPRGVLQVAAERATLDIPPGQSGRLQLAEWLVDARNPLTARVAVNRIWHKLFGEGLVRSVDYFGLPGERPSHPELLDHLARTFMAEGWSQKRLLRTLALSRAYRMSSTAEAASRGTAARGATIDPDNRLLWRMNARRLDAEAIRDAVLLVSGRLITQSGGPAMPLEIVDNTALLSRTGVNPPAFGLARFRPEQDFVRTLYLPIIRSGPQTGPGEVRNYFDFTQPAEFAGRRSITSVPTQALFLMNSELVKRRAADLAKLAVAGGADDRTRLEQLWLRVYGRPIQKEERKEAAAYLAELKQAPPSEGNGSAAEREAWIELCRALLAANEFLMRL